MHFKIREKATKRYVIMLFVLCLDSIKRTDYQTMNTVMKQLSDII